MAKIFRTEKLSLEGNIHLGASASDEFEILNVGGSTLMSKGSIESDISSLAASNSAGTGELESDISSLQAQRDVDEGTTDSDVSSLAGDISTNAANISTNTTNISTNKGELESDVSSLQAQRDADEATTDSDISSLAASISLNDVVAVSQAVNGTQGAPVSQVTVSFGRTFASAPKVVGIMKAGSSSPIIACQLSNITTTQAVFQLSDDIVTNGDYTLEVLASV